MKKTLFFLFAIILMANACSDLNTNKSNLNYDINFDTFCTENVITTTNASGTFTFQTNSPFNIYYWKGEPTDYIRTRDGYNFCDVYANSGTRALAINIKEYPYVIVDEENICPMVVKVSDIPVGTTAYKFTRDYNCDITPYYGTTNGGNPFTINGDWFYFPVKIRQYADETLYVTESEISRFKATDTLYCEKYPWASYVDNSSTRDYVSRYVKGTVIAKTEIKDFSDAKPWDCIRYKEFEKTMNYVDYTISVGTQSVIVRSQAQKAYGYVAKKDGEIKVNDVVEVFIEPAYDYKKERSSVWGSTETPNFEEHTLAKKGFTVKPHDIFVLDK